MTNLNDWVGKQESITDTIDLGSLRRMSATMDREDSWASGGFLPVGWHWIFFNAVERQSKLGSDGHPQRGSFLPPVDLPRRMWAGGRLHWKGSFRVDTTIEKESTILKVESKTGKSGEMVFVTVKHVYRSQGKTILEEEQDIVYRGNSTGVERAARSLVAGKALTPIAPGYTQRTGSHSKRVQPDPVQLFRYSAVTFNGHRIHYDAQYTKDVERYPGLVVHGPLLATMLLEFLQQQVCPGRFVGRFEFRVNRPTYDISDFYLHAAASHDSGRIMLWSTDNGGEVALDGWATCI